MCALRRISRGLSPIRRRRSISGGRKSSDKGPSYKIQIKAALLALKETRTGSSLPAIKKYLGASPAQYRYINAALRKGVATGFFIKNKGKYKLSPEAKKCGDKKPNPTTGKCPCRKGSRRNPETGRCNIIRRKKKKKKKKKKKRIKKKSSQKKKLSQKKRR